MSEREDVERDVDAAFAAADLDHVLELRKIAGLKREDAVSRQLDAIEAGVELLVSALVRGDSDGARAAYERAHLKVIAAKKVALRAAAAVAEALDLLEADQ